MSKDYPKRYKAMLDYFGIDNHFVAEITGRKYSAVKDATYSKTKAFSMWAKLAVWVFEEMRERSRQDRCTNTFEKEYGKATGVLMVKPKDNE